MGGAGLGGSAPDRLACHREGPAAGPQRDPLTNTKPGQAGGKTTGVQVTFPRPLCRGSHRHGLCPSAEQTSGETGLDGMGPGGGRMPVISRQRFPSGEQARQSRRLGFRGGGDSRLAWDLVRCHVRAPGLRGAVGLQSGSHKAPSLRGR